MEKRSGKYKKSSTVAGTRDGSSILLNRRNMTTNTTPRSLPPKFLYLNFYYRYPGASRYIY